MAARPKRGQQKEARIMLPPQHAGQKWVETNMRRFNWLIAGRRWRKTTHLARKSIVDVAQQGARILWVAPTYDQVRVGWDECRRGADGVFNFMKSEMVAELPDNGGRILFRSVDDPNNARGHTADGIVADEVGDFAEEAYYEVLRPIIMDTHGWFIGAGTPRGRNFVWREFTSALEDPDTLTVHAPTVGCTITPGGLIRKPHPLENPNVPFSEIVQMFKRMPERSFRQEIMAEFVEDSGAVFRNVTQQAIGQLEQPYKGTFVIGVDWGRALDFTVLTVIDCQRRTVVDWDRFNQIDYDFQRERLMALYRKWSTNNSAVSILAETNSIGQPNISALQRAGIPIYGWTASNLSKTKLIETLSLDIEQGLLTYPPIPELLQELTAYELDRLPSGLIRYSAPKGMHDDTVLSLALANHASRRPPIEAMQIDYEFTGGDDPDEDDSLLTATIKSMLSKLKITRSG